MRRAILALLALIAAGCLTLVGLLIYFSRDLPSVSSLRNYEPPQTTRIVDRNGEVLGEIFRERRTVVPLKRVPRVLILSILAAEDADFYQHEGLDYMGILRAVLRDVLSGSPAQGGSTITQQIVKLMLLSPERTLSRKIRELILARRLEQELTKDEILYLYVNHINFGHGRYGVQEAARFYFGKNVEDLTLAEASLIAGLPQAPSRLSPRSHPEAARRRQEYVLRQLESKRAEYWPDLSVADIESARNATITLAPAADVEQTAPEVVAIARQLLQERLSEEEYRRGGFTIHTTIDARLQRAARTALRAGLEDVDRRHGYRAPLRAASRAAARLPAIETLQIGPTYLAAVTGANDEDGVIELDIGGHRAVTELVRLARHNPEHLSASAFAAVGARARASILAPPDGPAEPFRARLELGPEGAVVVIDPRSREVLTLVGGYEAIDGFNRATQAVRQPGSSFKPILYSLAIQSRRFTPASLVLNGGCVYADWIPQNFEPDGDEGLERLRVSLSMSHNKVSCNLMETLSPQQTVDLARRFGITTELDATRALSLGASGVRVIEHTNAFATLAAGGQWAPTRLIRRIVDSSGHEVPLSAEEPAHSVLTAAEAFIVTNMLTSVVREGTASSAARRLRRPAAGKTGTSNEARDVWFVGYTPDVVAGVWIGFDSPLVSLGRNETGGRAAVPIWVDVIEAASQGRAPVEFAVPPGVVTAQIDPASGLLAYEGQSDAILEVFLEGTAPTETARAAGVADPGQFIQEQFNNPTPPAAPTEPATPPVP